ncbi:MAG: thioesterase family protein [Chloroflexi bacterium]|nr:thioesterase family protein [Chloroflexota bacterium]
MENIHSGLVAETSEIVTHALTAASHDSGLVAAYSTPAMVGLMETAAYQATQPHLPAGQTTVGVEIHIKHLAATPVGARVRARAEVTQVEGAMIHYKVEAWDAVDKIGEGTHVRFVVDAERFYKRFETKRAKMTLENQDNDHASG